MKKVKVLVEFRDAETGAMHKPGDVISVSEKRLDAIQSVHKNLVLVLVDAEPAKEKVVPVQPKKKK